MQFDSQVPPAGEPASSIAAWQLFNVIFALNKIRFG
jgi:hypothetical protein